MTLSLTRIAAAFALLGLLVLASVPLLRAYQSSSRGKSLHADLTVFSKAFRQYLKENGDWPATIASTPGVLPPGMEPYLKHSNWTRESPLGGAYVWQSGVRHNGRRIRAAILITHTTTSSVLSDLATLKSIDRLIDDGNLETGSFRLGFEGEPLWIIEP